MKKLIFLDIDGVLNHDEWYDFFWKYLHQDKEKNYDYDLDYRAIATLNKILDEVPSAEIVISSTWRFDMPDTTSRLQAQGLNIPVTGYTSPKMDFDSEFGTIPRGVQIEHYVNDLIYHKNEPLVNYVILDDDIDMLYSQKNNFIHVNNNVGLTKEDVDKCITILRRDKPLCQ